MEIKKSTPADLPRLMEIYETARAFMAAHGNPRQWGATNWPPESLIRRDIETGKSYACWEDGRIIAVFYYDHGPHAEPGYDHLEGNWIGEETYGVVHRIATDGTVRGAGSFCLRWAFEQCGHLRIDTHPDNVVMQGMLEKNGFLRCGIVHVEEDQDPRYAYEKLST